MRFSKILLSACLLFAYSMGLAHDIIPHCHHGKVVTEGVDDRNDGHRHYHERCAHEANDVGGPGHIKHADHHDYSVVGLLICLLSESSHPASDDFKSHCLPITGNDFSGNGLAKSKSMQASKFVFSFFEDKPATIVFGFSVFAAILFPPLSNSPHRGPPSTFI